MSDDDLKIYKNKNGIKVSVLINLGNYENIRFTSGRYDDVEKCFQELEDAVGRIQTLETEQFLESFLQNRRFRGQLKQFKELHPNH